MDREAQSVQLAGAIARARAHSPFLAGLLDRHSDITSLLTDGMLDEALGAAPPELPDLDVAAALRLKRGRVALALAVGDLAGLVPLERLTLELSNLADEALDLALGATIEERTPGEIPRGFAIIALGKHGSRELNYSSDIDLIYLFDPKTLPRRAREEPSQAAIRIGQRVAELLQKRDANGYVFRVDLRLRPSPEVTPTALPADAAISYYESSALPWERAAFIRARAVAGDRQLGNYFLDAVHPFVWRRSLDFGAIAEIQSISSRIRDHFAQGQRFGPGYDLKRGRGGIREVEFFTQIHQLIHGGREPPLRAPGTLDALKALAAADRIPGEEGHDLGEAYRLYRTIEHRLQMVDDRQTHSLPNDPGALDNVARLHGVGDGRELLDLLRPSIERVGSIYDKLGPERTIRLPSEPQALETWLNVGGFPDPAAARARIESWRSGKPRSLRTTAAREAFEAMLPVLTEAFGAAPAAMDALNRFDDIVCKLPSGVNFFRLLEARPALAQVLAQVLGHAPALAGQLGRRPELLDGLIDATAFDPAGSVDELCAEFLRAERQEEGYELLLDRVRHKVNEKRFALGVQIVMARSDPLDVAAGYARVAEAAVRVLSDATVAEFEKAHGKVPGSELVILGLGRLGGAELTYASDLDLIYLFTGTHEAESDGRKPLRATDYFNRLSPRVTAALSVPTAAGPLYDVDTRLRPSGKDGMLAVSLASFAEYQQQRAWTFEHMALTRARPVYGSAEGRAALQAIIDSTLARPRDPASLIADAARMRRDIAAHKPPSGAFDIKLGEGGLVDLEFAIQVLQLRERKGLDPRLGVAIDELIQAGFLRHDIEEAHRLLTRMLVTLRLVSPSSSEPVEGSRQLVARACGMKNWSRLLAAHDAARQKVSALWGNVASSEER